MIDRGCVRQRICGRAAPSRGSCFPKAYRGMTRSPRAFSNWSKMHDVLIVGGGIGGLTLALELHQRSIPCRIFESAPRIQAVGVGINILPHATRVLADLGLQDALAKVAVET